MIVDTNPFTSTTINMVSISTESKCTMKEASSSQLVQQSKQVQRPKSIVIKEHTRALNYDTSRRNERKEWRPKLERRVEHMGQFKPPRQSVFERIQSPKGEKE